jgi:hypothetical protein
VAIFSGVSFEDMIAGLAWPSTLPIGWTVEWDLSLASNDSAE